MTENALTTQGGALALSEEDMALMVEGARTGVETFGLRQLIVPYLGIIQGTSGYIKRGDPAYIDSARVGDIIDTLALKPMESAVVIPCKYEDHVTEWEVKIERDRNGQEKRGRGRLIKQWFTDHSKYHASQKRGRDDGEGFPRITTEGNDINMVPTYYCLLYNNGNVRPVVVTFASTQAKKSRRWNGLIDSVEFEGPNGPFTAPIYAAMYKLSTVTEGSGEKTFPGWKIEPVGLTLAAKNGRHVWQRAQEVRKAVEEGQMRSAAPPRDVTDEASATTNDAARHERDVPPSRQDSEDIPF